MGQDPLTILKSIPLGSAPDENVIDFEELKRDIRSGAILRRLGRYPSVTILVPDLATLHKPLATAMVARSLSRGPLLLEDLNGSRVAVDARYLARLLVRFAKDLRRRSGWLRGIEREVSALRAPAPRPRVRLSAPPLYLRADGPAGLIAGGSVTHLTGVLNRLDEFVGKPIFVTTSEIPGVRADLKVHLVPRATDFQDFAELPQFFRNQVVYEALCRLLDSTELSFLYQRYTVNSYCGIKFARQRAIPLVLEYNGSEIWLSRNWGEPLRYERLAAQIERLNLEVADLIVVVSRALRDELLSRGIDDSRILLNPNGVDTERYSPEVDGDPTRREYGIGDRIVVGFIGTFGPWHGVEVLADAYARLLREQPDYRRRLHLLMIGDGLKMPEVRAHLQASGASTGYTLTGIVPQEQGPSFLAACDILVAPHVPNADGTPFFGSPTKLFEYMAMGKGIVASDLDQIGETLQHGKTAWLVRPGDVDDLKRGLIRLVEDTPLRVRLGAEARQVATASYTWREHTRKIVDALKERCG